jgi:molecular chaperone HtpG
MDIVKKKGYDVLVLSDDIDEFMIQVLREYDKHEFKSINQADLDLLDDKEKEAIKSKEDENRELLAALQDILKDEVKEVKLSTRLSDSPVCLVSGEGLSFEMEKVISQMPGEKEMKADKILEINPNHPLFQAVGRIYANDRDLLPDYAWILYDQALLIEGIVIKDPVAFADKMVRLMVKAAE